MTFDSESGERLRSAWRRFQEELPPEPGAVRRSSAFMGTLPPHGHRCRQSREKGSGRQGT